MPDLFDLVMNAVIFMAFGWALASLIGLHVAVAKKKAAIVERALDRAHTARWYFCVDRHPSRVFKTIAVINGREHFAPRMRKTLYRALLFRKPKLSFYERKLLGQVWAKRSDYFPGYRSRRHPHRHDRAMHRYLARELRKIWG